MTQGTLPRRSAARPITVRLALLLLLCVALPATAMAQATVQVERTTAVLEQPRGDSFVVGSVQAGDTLILLRTQGAWVLVAVPIDRASESTWRQGWVSRAALVQATLPANPPSSGGTFPSAASRPGTSAQPAAGREMMLRVFGQAGGALFSARDSFEAILGSAFGPTFGGGAQVVFSNGGFLQAGVERFTNDGNRVMVGANQLFALPTPVSVTTSARP